MLNPVNTSATQFSFLLFLFLFFPSLPCFTNKETGGERFPEIIYCADVGQRSNLVLLTPYYAAPQTPWHMKIYLYFYRGFSCTWECVHYNQEVIYQHILIIKANLSDRVLVHGFSVQPGLMPLAREYLASVCAFGEVLLTAWPFPQGTA